MKEISFCLKELPKNEAIQEMAKRYPQAKPEQISLALTFLKTAADLSKIMELYFTKYDLSTARFSFLMLLLRNPEGLNPSDIAEKMGVTKANMTGLIDGLIAKNYVSRQGDPDDRRIVKIKLAKQGEKLLDKILPDHYSRVSQTMKKLTSKDIKMFKKYLQTIAENLNMLVEESN